MLTPCVLIVLFFASSPPARAAAEARIVGTDPPAVSTLGRSESFYTRIEYQTGEPISLWARPYLDGEPVAKTLSNASPQYTGSGEALGWFALTEPGAVDEVRILAGGGQPYREWEIARRPVQLRWTGASASGGPAAAWVAELLAADEARRREDAARRAREPVSGGEVALFGGFMLLVLILLLASFGVPLLAIRKWRGVWRIAAVAPLALMAFVVLRLIVDTARDPTSHNLWPFEILYNGVPALAIIGVLTLARKFFGAGGSQT